MNWELDEDTLAAKLSPDIFWKKIHDSISVLTVGEVTEEDSMFEIDGPAVNLWLLLSEGLTVQEGLNAFMVRFPGHDKEEIEDFILELEELGFIE